MVCLLLFCCFFWGGGGGGGSIFKDEPEGVLMVKGQRKGVT